MSDQSKKGLLPVSECFRTIQGEGALIGKPTIFVRVGGCDYRCRLCDTDYAVLPEYRPDWRLLSTEEVFAEVQRLSGSQPILITLSGGNPAMQPFGALIDLGCLHGYRFSLETQGSIAQPWFAKLAYLPFRPNHPVWAIPGQPNGIG